MMLKNNNLNRKIGYHNNSQINASPIKDLNKMFLLNINNKSAPKKINIIYKVHLILKEWNDIMKILIN